MEIMKKRMIEKWPIFVLVLVNMLPKRSVFGLNSRKLTNIFQCRERFAAFIVSMRDNFSNGPRGLRNFVFIEYYILLLIPRGYVSRQKSTPAILLMCRQGALTVHTADSNASMSPSCLATLWNFRPDRLNYSAGRENAIFSSGIFSETFHEHGNRRLGHYFPKSISAENRL